VTAHWSDDPDRADRWADRLDRVHIAGERPTGPPPPTKIEEFAPVNRHATDTVTPRVLEQLDEAIIDMAEFRKHVERALGRLYDGLAGYATQPGTSVATPIDVVLENRGGIVAWTCSSRRCARDPNAHGTAMNDIDARRAFLDHHAEEHTFDPATQPERGAMSGEDAAARDIATIQTAARQLRHFARGGRDVTDRWGITRIGAKVDLPNDAMWCASCKRANHFSARRPEGGEVCRWCADKLVAVNAVRAERDAEPLDALPIEAIEAYARGDNVYVRDIERWAALASSQVTDVRRPRRSGGRNSG
jgi:hypothetical protein